MPVPILPNRYRHLFFQPKRSVSYQSNPCPPITPAMALATAIITFKRIFQLFFIHVITTNFIHISLINIAKVDINRKMTKENRASGTDHS